MEINFNSPQFNFNNDFSHQNGYQYFPPIEPELDSKTIDLNVLGTIYTVDKEYYYKCVEENKTRVIIKSKTEIEFVTENEFNNIKRFKRGMDKNISKNFNKNFSKRR